MNGLELSRLYYEQVGKERLRKWNPEVFGRMAIGLAGEGSECFGFDDECSRDHDWGPGFCVWLRQDDYLMYAKKLRRLYEQLPKAFAGFPPRKVQEQASERVGILCTQNWYYRYAGSDYGPHWLRVPETFLAAATNGEIFYDPLGEFSAVRQKLLDYYPEDARRKRLSDSVFTMAQAGQYNYPRCIRRGEVVAAELALAEFTRASLSAVYLLNRRYAPFYKWMHRGIRDFPVLPRAYDLFKRLTEARDAGERETFVERICALTAAELRRQGLSGSDNTFLSVHSEEIADGIQDSRIRNRSVMGVRRGGGTWIR